jgi:hypothetical protein
MSDQFKKDIETHIEMLVDDDMRSHALASTDHDTAFQIFRLLSGYRLALTQLTECKAQIEAMKCCGNCGNNLISETTKTVCYPCRRFVMEGHDAQYDNWQLKGGK